MAEEPSAKRSPRAKPDSTRKKDPKRNTYLLLRAYYITHEQHEFIRWRAYNTGISQSASIREAIDRMEAEEGPAPKKDAVKRPKTTKEDHEEGANA